MSTKGTLNKIDDLLDTLVDDGLWQQLPPHIKSKILGLRIDVIDDLTKEMSSPTRFTARLGKTVPAFVEPTKDNKEN